MNNKIKTYIGLFRGTVVWCKSNIDILRPSGQLVDGDGRNVYQWSTRRIKGRLRVVESRRGNVAHIPSGIKFLHEETRFITLLGVVEKSGTFTYVVALSSGIRAEVNNVVMMYEGGDTWTIIEDDNVDFNDKTSFTVDSLWTEGNPFIVSFGTRDTSKVSFGG